MKLRDYQELLISSARSSFKKGIKSVLIQSPTGSGKTALLTEMFRAASLRGKRCWMIVHRRELIEQTSKAFDKINLNHGIVSGSETRDVNLPVLVCGIDTLRNRHTALKKPDFICFDECHHLGARTWQNLYNAYPDAYKIGLTATPWRLDGKGLSEFFQDIIIGPRVRDLINQGWLCDYKIFAPIQPDMGGVKTSMGDFVKAELFSRMNNAAITGSCVNEYLKHCSGKRGIVFAVNIEHSEIIMDEFNSRGVECEHVDANTHPDLRHSALERFRSGETKVLTNVGLFGEGFDLPDIECVMLMRPTKSLSLYLQMVGRALRPTENKSHAVILDHSGSVLEHDLPCHEHEWSLAGREKKKSNLSPVKICPNCFAAQPSSIAVCDECGYEFRENERSSRDFSAEDGDLNELDIEKFKELQRKKAKKKEFWRRAFKIQDRQELEGLCIEYGYKKGFSHYAWKYVTTKRKNNSKRDNVQGDESWPQDI